MSLKFELFTQAFNEEYLLPYMVDFYKSKIGDNIIFNLFDNGSTDKTVEIAKNLGFKIHKVVTNGELRDGGAGTTGKSFEYRITYPSDELDN